MRTKMEAITVLNTPLLRTINPDENTHKCLQVPALPTLGDWG